MAKVTSKLQITIPKALADTVGIAAGSEVDWMAVGGTLQIVPRTASPVLLGRDERLELFRTASERQHKRNADWAGYIEPRHRGWTREELYDRGRPR
jgi:AbrB family looped-hinge helix DNA binding protein